MDTGGSVGLKPKRPWACSSYSSLLGTATPNPAATDNNCRPWGACKPDATRNPCRELYANGMQVMNFFLKEKCQNNGRVEMFFI